MTKIFEFKPVINKRNGQMVLSLPKKKMPISLKKVIKEKGKIKVLRLKFEGYDI